MFVGSMPTTRVAQSCHANVIQPPYGPPPTQAVCGRSDVRILMISDVYFPRINGVSTSIQTFRRELVSAHHEVVLVAPSYPQGHAGDDGELIRVPSSYVPRDPEDRMMQLGPLKRLRRQLSQQRFDIVHIQTPFVAHYQGVAIARELGVPVIETYHTYFEEYLYHYVPLSPRGLMRFLARRFTVSQCNALNALVVPSIAMKTALEKYGVRTPMHIIPTGLDMKRFNGGDGARFREKLGIAPDQPTLVHVGRIAHEKNIEFLFRMLMRVRAMIPNVVMIVAGEGPALRHCRNVVREAGLEPNVRFVGYLNRDRELLDCYRAGDLFVFSSKTETQGLVLLEAMALGVPVVSLAHMGTVDILQPQRGCVIAPENEEAFATQVVTLLKDDARRRHMATEAVAYASTWSAQATTARLVDLYRDVMQPGSAASTVPA